jgi:serine/alanine adding enzyme
MEIVELGKRHSEIWNEFVKNHPHGNLFQTYYFFELHLGIKNYSPFAYGIIKDRKIIGLVVGVIQFNFFFPLKNFTKRAIIVGGPLIQNNDEKILDFLLCEVSKKIKNEVIYTQFRNLWDYHNSSAVFNKHSFSYQPHLNIINDLTQNEENIRQKINKNKRGNFNKSRNKGTQFIEIQELEDYNNAVELIIHAYKRIGLPCPNKEYFFKAFSLLNPLGILKTFIAVYEKEIVGVRIELCYNEKVYDWYAGSNDKHNNKYPNDFLLYNIIFWSKLNNYSKFDFGGAGTPEIPYRVRDHKMKFGGDLVEYGRFECIHSKKLFKVGNLGLRFYKLLKI